MDITEVRVKLVERSSERLRAFCSITLDGDFVIRDLKIIDGTNGAFVAMPSRKLADRCARCGNKNHLRAKFCNECGQKLNEARAPKDAQGRAKLHADVAHPINAACRERIQAAVLEAFHAEVERSKSPDYRPPKYDDFAEDFEESLDEHPAPRQPAIQQPQPMPEPVEDEAEEPVGAAGKGEQGGFEDYNSLIAELKKDAAGRRDKHEDSRAGARGTVEQPEARREGGERRPDRGREGRPEQHGPGRDVRRQEGSEGRRPEPAPAPKIQPPPQAPPPPPPKPAGEDDFAAGL